MAAALLTMVYVGKSGRRYCISAYANDTSNNLVRFDEAKVAAAGSPDQYNVKEDGVVDDIIFTSDLATPTHVQLLRNGAPTGDIFDVTAQLASVVNRPNIDCPYAAGDKIALMQIA